MNAAPRPGRVDPTVRALLRGFVSPALADRWAARLQPVAVADHRAAVTGAVSLLLDQAGVDPTDLALALVEDVGWSSPDAGSLLGMTALEVRVALATGGRSTPRMPRHHREPWVLGGGAAPDVDGPHGHTNGTGTGPADPGTTDCGPGPDGGSDDVELRSRLPRTPTGADRRPALVLVVVALLGLAGLAVRLGTPPAVEGDVAPVASPTSDVSPSPSAGPVGSPSPTTTPTPSPAPTRTPTPDAPVLEALRLVAVDDVLAGDDDPADVGQGFGTVDDVRVWGALDRAGDEAVVVRVAVTAPDGRRSVRPVLVPAGVHTFALSLPAELGDAPGRWLATAVLGDGPELRREAELVPVDDMP